MYLRSDQQSPWYQRKPDLKGTRSILRDSKPDSGTLTRTELGWSQALQRSCIRSAAVGWLDQLARQCGPQGERKKVGGGKRRVTKPRLMSTSDCGTRVDSSSSEESSSPSQLLERLRNDLMMTRCQEARQETLMR